MLRELIALAALAPLACAAAPESVRARTQRTFARIPLTFEKNVGQGPAWAGFIARAPGYQLAVGGAEAAIAPARGAAQPLRFRLHGASSQARAELLDPLPGESHYFPGNDPAAWRTHVRQYRRLRLSGVYPGVNMTFYGRQDQLEYDFELEPGADVRQIQMEFDAAGPLKMDGNGDLIAPAGDGEVRLHAPLVHQRAGGVLRPLRGAQRIAGGNRVSFEVADYDPALPVVIDPVLTYTTTFSGGRPVFNDVAVDAAGNTFLTGCAASGMPLVNYFLEEYTTDRDVIVAKLSPDGNTLLYSTYLGGGCASAIELDGEGNVVLAGSTTHKYYALRNPASAKQGGGFVTKLRADGAEILYSTFLGGDQTDAVAGLALDAGGNAWVTGRTRAASFPFTAALGGLVSPDAGRTNVRTGFVTKYSPAGAVLFSGSLGAGIAPSAVAVDAAGAAYLGGALCGESYPAAADGMQTAPAGCEAFVAKLAAGGAGFEYSYTFGGTNWDGVSQLAVDAGGNVTVAGVTFSPDFPVAANAPQKQLRGQWDVYLARLNSAGDGLLYATYLGGSREESAAALVVDSAGRATVAGTTTSDDFPLANALRPLRNGNSRPLYLSDDGGRAWTGVYSQGEQDGAFYPWRGAVLALAATADPNLLWSADRFNIYRSADAGATWRMAYSKPNQWQVRNIVPVPANPDALYVVAGPPPPPSGTTAPATTTFTVWYSADGGATFESRGAFPAAAADNFNLWASAAEANVAYALIRRRADPQLYRTGDNGQTWERTAGELPELLQSMTLDRASGTRLYAGTDTGMYLSEDAGATWNILESTRCPVDRMGCQFQEIFTDAALPRTILFTRRGGRDYGYTGQQLQLHRSDDEGRTWRAATTPVVADASAVTFDGAGNYYVAFTGSNGLYSSADGGRTWTPLAPTAPFWTDTVNAVALPPRQPARVVAATSAGNEGFLATLAADGGSWVQSTYLGGAGGDSIGGLRVDDQGWFVVVTNTLQRLENMSACDVVLSPAETAVHFLGSTARIQVRSGDGCAWRVENPAPWIAITSPDAGSGWGTFEFIAAPNPGTSPRMVKLTVNGQELTVTQPGGPPCTLTPDVFRILSHLPADDGVAVQFTAGCQWSVAQDASWVRLDKTVEGVTTSIIPYSVAANTGKTARRAVLTFTANGAALAGTHTILQAAANCKVEVTASASTVPAAGGLVTVKLQDQPADCSAWVADSGVSWAYPAPGPIPSPGVAALPAPPNYGTGAGTVTFFFQPNPNATERSLRLQMGGVGVPVTQAGSACELVLKPATQVLDAVAFQGLLTVGAPGGCPWTAKSDNAWIRVTSVTPTRGTSFSSGPAGNGRVFFTAEQNKTGAARTGTITVGTQTFVVTQTP